ncbi:MAG: hypothetical protein OXI24_02330 [Candidatus Poribacteria bacterium]|nr:hypothetical protein [Candidatus Poribacteria bacterium]
MLEQILDSWWIIVIVFVLLGMKGILASGEYEGQKDDRIETVRKLQGEGHDWKQITLTLEKMGFKNSEGENLTEDNIREEFAGLIAKEEKEREAKQNKV